MYRCVGESQKIATYMAKIKATLLVASISLFLKQQNFINKIGEETSETPEFGVVC
jgi:hypothetical protein